jgi:hypothetical protein
MDIIACFLIYAIGTIHRYGRYLPLDLPAIIGMVIVACIPYINIIVAALVLLDCAILSVRDIRNAFKD